MADDLAKEVRHLADVLEKLIPAVGLLEKLIPTVGLLEELLALIKDAQGELLGGVSHGPDELP